MRFSFPVFRKIRVKIERLRLTTTNTEDRTMKEFLAVAKALSDESRVRALMALSGGELCVCQLIELLGLAASTVSKHMSLLYQAGLVETRKEGRWVYYRLADPEAPALAQGAIEWMSDGLRHDPKVKRDAARLRRVKKMRLAKLCEHYRS